MRMDVLAIDRTRHRHKPLVAVDLMATDEMSVYIRALLVSEGDIALMLHRQRFVAPVFDAVDVVGTIINLVGVFVRYVIAECVRVFTDSPDTCGDGRALSLDVRVLIDKLSACEEGNKRSRKHKH